MTPPLRPAVVVNPTKVADAARLRARLEERLHKAGSGPAHWLETTPGDPGAGQAGAAVALGADLVLAYGGDGTQRAVAGALAGTGVPLGLLPAGTGNLLARNLGVPLRLDRALDIALAGRHRQIDLCYAGTAPFVVMAGIGFDARMMAATSPTLKRRVGWLAYGLAAIEALHEAPKLTIDLELDSGRRVSTSGAGVLVANVGTLTAGMELLPAAREDDGLLTVGVLTPDHLHAWASLALRLAGGQPPAATALPTWQTSRLWVSVAPSSPIEADGEPIGEVNGQEFRVAAGSLTACVPPRGRSPRADGTALLTTSGGVPR